MRKGIEITGFIILILQLFATSFASAQTVWLDELDLSAATQGYGVPMKNRSNEGKTLTIAGEHFDRGFGTHAVSSLMVLLDGKAVSFSAKVGLDDEVKGQQPAAEFELYGDGQKLW